MIITTVSYGRTIVLEGRSFKQEKAWFNYEATVESGDTPSSVMEALRARCDADEKDERTRRNRY